MPETFPNIPIDLSSSKSREARILRADFGDGYYQAAGDGINPYKEKWSLSFSHRKKSVIDIIIAFLETSNSVTPFFWTAPNDVRKKWIQDGEYSLGRSGPDAYSLSFKISRVYVP